MARYSMANLGAWALKTKRRRDAVVKASAQDTMAIAQTPKAKGGRMPVLTGNLRGSLSSSLHGGTALTGPESYVMVAGSMEAGDLASFRWGAAYAAAVNNGAQGRAGAHFVDGAVDQWPATVRANVAKAQAAVG